MEQVESYAQRKWLLPALVSPGMPFPIPTVASALPRPIYLPECLSACSIQVLPPSQVTRARIFGSKLTLPGQWAAVDDAYFDAPGESLGPLCWWTIHSSQEHMQYFAVCASPTPTDTSPYLPLIPPLCHACTGAFLAPLGSRDPLPPVPLPSITMVFCSVEGGSQYASSASKGKADAHDVHLELLAVMRGALRQLPGGYLVRRQAGEFKYLAVFAHPEVGMKCGKLSVGNHVVSLP